MTFETAFKSIDFISVNYPLNTGIIFFGGEPLLRKDLIRETIEYSKTKKPSGNTYFHYKVTTNGLLLDSEFLEYADSTDLQVSISIDGIEKAHDVFRKYTNGTSTFAVLQEKAQLLLKYQPYAKVLMTITPETLPFYSESVDFLLQMGFKYIIVSLNYAGKWQDKHLKELKIQYKELAKLYEKYIDDEKKFYFSPFEMKLASYIRQENLECYRCHLGINQISIAHDGQIYPCVQFVKDGLSNQNYSIGNIYAGIESDKQKNLYQDSIKPAPSCFECDINDRCNNKCSCLNWQLTGELNQISPIICETERILIPIVDKLGEKLYKKGSPMFIQKHYNAVYPIISMIEDMH
jgi:uncharacterized protein